MRACNVANTAAGRVAKFLALYEGPYTVKNKIARNTYKLTNTNAHEERGQFRASDLKHYYSGNGPGGKGSNT